MTKFDELEKRIRRLEEKVSKLFQLAKVKTVDGDNATVVCILADDKSETAPLPWMVRHAGKTIEWWAPEEGEQVLVMNLTGILDISIVLPALYSTAFPAPESDLDIRKLILSDGTSVEHNSKAKTLAIDTNADVTIDAKSATVNSQGDVTVDAKANATVKAIGDVAIDGGTINMNQGTAGGVVCQAHTCAFTGGPHPQGSVTVKGAM